MANISSMMSTTNTTSTYQSNGIAGLASGMDTEAVVEAMTSDIQAKIDKVKQQQTKLEWKQDAYREVISMLTSFQDKYFSYASPTTNLLSSALYNCVNKATQGANASKITVTSSNNSAETAYTVTGVKQLATKAQYLGTSQVSSGGITTGSISFGDRDTNLVAGKDFTFEYDNVKYTITIPEDAVISKDNQAEDLAKALNKALSEQTVSGSSTLLSERLKFSANGGKLEMKTVSPTDGRSFEIKAGDNVSSVLDALGFKEGAKGNATTGITGESNVSAVKNSGFSLDGKKLTFDYNGLSKTIAFTAEDTAEIMNLQGATEDETNALRMSKMKDIIQGKVNDAFGAGKIEVKVAEGNKLNFDTTDPTSTLSITSTTLDTMGTTGIFGIAKGTSNRLDTGKTLKALIGGDKEEYAITVNGKEFKFKADTALSTVINKINNDKDAGINISYLNTTNKFSITADEYGASEKINISGDIATALFGKEIGDADVTAGQDLIMSIKYAGESEETTITRNSNNVTLDGVNFTVNETFGYKTEEVQKKTEDGQIVKDAEGNPVMETVTVRDNTVEAVSFKNESDTENTIKVIKEMAEAYNKIVDKVNEYVSTKKARTSEGKNGGSTYEPLTEAQKKEMTEDEIKNWEKKAKEGILFGDSTLRQLASDLRFAFATAVGENGFASEIGITVASSYSGNGKITIDEQKLSEALKNEPDKVRAMFTATTEDAPNTSGFGAAGGFATRIKSIMETNAKTTGSYKGKLVELAGLQNNATTDNNYIARQQKLLTNRLDYLQDVLATRQKRYQSQFSSLEVYISRMNSQSAYLSSAFSY